MGTVLSRRGAVRAAALSLGLLASVSRSAVARATLQEIDGAADAELLFSAVVDNLPDPPAVVRLVRITLESGAELDQLTLAGPQFGLVERGVLSLRAEGEVVVSTAPRDGTPARAVVPQPGESADLATGDQWAVPPAVAIVLANEGREALTLLAAVILPSSASSASQLLSASGTPVAGSDGDVGLDLLGEAEASGWPAPPYLVQLDRVVVGTGEPVPGYPGPVLLAVEQGTFGFALVDGQIQTAASDPSDAPDDRTAVRVDEGEAIFFGSGVNAIPREGSEPNLMLLRFGVSSLPLEDERSGPARTNENEQETTAAPDDAGVAAASPSAGPATSETPGDQRARIIEDGVRLRSSPSTGGDVVAELGQGVEIIVTGDAVDAEGLRWLPVRRADDPEINGYVAEQFVEPLD